MTGGVSSRPKLVGSAEVVDGAGLKLSAGDAEELYSRLCELQITPANWCSWFSGSYAALSQFSLDCFISEHNSLYRRNLLNKTEIGASSAWCAAILNFVTLSVEALEPIKVCPNDLSRSKLDGQGIQISPCSAWYEMESPLRRIMRSRNSAPASTGRLESDQRSHFLQCSVGPSTYRLERNRAWAFLRPGKIGAKFAGGDMGTVEFAALGFRLHLGSRHYHPQKLAPGHVPVLHLDSV